MIFLKELANKRAAFLIALIGGSIFTRLIAHPANFTAISAASLFAGALLANRKHSLLVPIGAMMISDLVLGLHFISIFVYLGIVASTLLGWCLSSQSRLSSFLSLSILSGILFFLVSNFGVWVEGVLYPRTAQGLIACFAAAIPFLANTIYSNVIFITLLVGIYRLGERVCPSIRISTAPSFK